MAVILVLLDRRFRLGHGKVFALYVLLYTAGRFWIEALRIDSVNEIGGFRLNNYTSLIAFVGALIWFVWLVRHRPGREAYVEGEPAADPGPDQDPASAAAEDSGDAGPSGEAGGSGESGTAVVDGSGEQTAGASLADHQPTAGISAAEHSDSATDGSTARESDSGR